MRCARSVEGGRDVGSANGRKRGEKLIQLNGLLTLDRCILERVISLFQKASRREGDILFLFRFVVCMKELARKLTITSVSQFRRTARERKRMIR